MSTIESTGPGLATAEYIREMVVELSHELATEERKLGRDAREEELQKGLAAADEMRDKAANEMGGAFLSGSLTMLSGGGELWGASALGDASGDTARKQIEVRIEAAKSLSQLGGSVNGLFGSFGDKDAANAQTLEAESKAAGHKADEAESSRQEIRKTEDSVKSLEQDMGRTLHAGMMAILARQ
jgi:hypothetical protein